MLSDITIQDGLETLRTRGRVQRYGDSYAIILLDVRPEYVGRKVASFEFSCCDRSYVYNGELDPRRWIRIIEYKYVRLDGVFAVPAIRVPLNVAVRAYDVLAHLHKSRELIDVKLVVV